MTGWESLAQRGCEVTAGDDSGDLTETELLGVTDQISSEEKWM